MAATRNILKIVTWKKSDVYGTENHWGNTWWFSVPFEPESYAFNQFVTYLCQVERSFYHNHVIFNHVTAVKWNEIGRETETSARVNAPFNGNIRGHWGNPPVVAPYEWKKRVSLYVDKGYRGMRWFTGGLATVDGVLLPNGRLGWQYRDFWNGILQDWLSGFKNTHDAIMVVPQGINRTGNIIEFTNVIKMTADGITITNDIKKAQLNNYHPGIFIFRELVDVALRFEQWRNKLYEHLEFSGDFVPADELKGRSQTAINEAHDILKRATDLANGLYNNQPVYVGPVFRFKPDAAEITAATAIPRAMYNSDIQQVVTIPTYQHSDGKYYVTNNNADSVMRLLSKYSASLAQLIPADWRNPFNNSMSW